MSLEGWKKYKLGEIIEDIAMGPFGSNIKVDNFIDRGVPVIRGANLNEGGFDERSFVFVSEEKAQSLKRSLAYPDDLVFTHRGTIGQVGIIPYNKFPKYLVSQSQMRLTVNKNFIEPKFLYYFFRSSVGQYELLKNASQVGVPAIAQPTQSLKDVDIQIPDLETQKEIVNLLSTLDDKIVLNRETNSTLEAIAQAIFKEWFVDFNYPGATGELVDSPLGPIPKGWRVTPLDQMATFLNGLALQRYPPVPDETPLPVIKIKELRNGVTESSDLASRAIPEQYIVENGDLLFSWSGSLEVMFWAGGEGALNQHLFKVTSDEYPLWFVFLWIKHHLPNFRGIAADKATTMGHIKRKDLTEALCLIPSDLAPAENAFGPLFKLHLRNSLENSTLINIRDLLLEDLIA